MYLSVSRYFTSCCIVFSSPSVPLFFPCDGQIPILLISVSVNVICQIGCDGQCVLFMRLIKAKHWLQWNFFSLLLLHVVFDYETVQPWNNVYSIVTDNVYKLHETTKKNQKNRSLLISHHHYAHKEITHCGWALRELFDPAPSAKMHLFLIYISVYWGCSVIISIFRTCRGTTPHHSVLRLMTAQNAVRVGPATAIFCTAGAVLFPLKLKLRLHGFLNLRLLLALKGFQWVTLSRIWPWVRCCNLRGNLYGCTMQHLFFRKKTTRWRFEWRLFVSLSFQYRTFEKKPLKNKKESCATLW